MSLPTSLALFLILLGVSAFISAAETVLFALPHARALREKSKDVPASARRLLADREATMAGLLFADLLANFGALFAAADAWSRALPGLPLISSTILTVATAGLLILLAGEVLPRAIAVRLPEHGVRWVFAPTLALLVTLAPLRASLTFTGGLLLRALGHRAGWRGPLVAELEFHSLVEIGGPGGTLEEDEREMVEGVLDFGNSTAEDIMTPRTELDWVEQGDPREEVARVFEKGGHSRLLVCDRSPDKIIGFVHYRDVLLHPEQPWPELIRNPISVAPQTSLADLLDKFRANRIFLAVVVDEYGGNKGIVTLNDLLGAVFGDIEPEEETSPESAAAAESVRPDGENAWIAAGRAELADLEERIGLRLPDDRGRTLGGFVINTLGHIPDEGETLHAEGWEFHVLRVAGPRIEELRLRCLSKTPPSMEPEP